MVYTASALAGELEPGLSGVITGATAVALRAEPTAGSLNGHFFAVGPTDDRSKWHLRDAKLRLTDRRYAWFSDMTIKSPRRSLTLVLAVLTDPNLGPPGWRWRLAARIIEIAYPEAADLAATGDAEAKRILPVYEWVRWRVLSEPFRNPSGSDAVGDLREGDRRPCGIDGGKGLKADPYGAAAYARSAFRGCRSLRRRAAESRVTWAETLLEYQDHPTLARVDVERESRLLVFRANRQQRLLRVDSDGSRTAEGRSTDSVFVTWFSREFYGRRFMVREMWNTVRSSWKKLTLWSAAFTALLGFVAGVLIAPVEPLGLSRSSWSEWVHLIVAILFAVSLAITMGSLLWGVLWSEDDERYVYPFLLRFAAGTVIGTSVIITMRAGWIENLTDPGSGNDWRRWFILLGLVFVGFAYLLFEARLEGPTAGSTIRRALGVWGIGLMWALTIAAVDVLAIAPVFTEDYLQFSSHDTRLWGFSVTALASLDLGIFLQVLWEDRPVTYPLGALRLSGRR